MQNDRRCVYAYIILDPHNQTKDIHEICVSWSKLSQGEQQDEKEKKKYDFDMKNAGVFVLISSKPIPAKDILEAYYNRQTIERIFGHSKSDLDLLPIRCHNEKTISGYLFLQFLLLILFLEIREHLQKGKEPLTVERALLILRQLKCLVYDNKVIIKEQTKQQKMIYEHCGIIVDDFKMGI